MFNWQKLFGSHPDTSVSKTSADAYERARKLREHAELCKGIPGGARQSALNDAAAFQRRGDELKAQGK